MIAIDVGAIGASDVNAQHPMLKLLIHKASSKIALWTEEHKSKSEAGKKFFILMT